MKTLKLQMQITLDGFVAGPEGQLDWMTVGQDQKAIDVIHQLTDTSDTIIMGRKMSPEFLTYWETIVDKDPQNPEFSIARKMVDIPKIIFSKTQKSTTGRNARVENGDLRTEIGKLKKGSGKDIVAYGGAGFVSSLIKENLIDDYYFFINPIAIGKGLRIFHDRTKLQLVDSTHYNGGILINHYKPI